MAKLFCYTFTVWNLGLWFILIAGCATVTLPPNENKTLSTKNEVQSHTLEQTTQRPPTFRSIPDDGPYRAQGKASWYGQAAHGTQTASGEVYDIYEMTAAHATLPLLTRVKVTNLSTDRSVIVKINDRLPSSSQVLIRLSYAAARQLGLLGHASPIVEVEKLTLLPTQYLLPRSLQPYRSIRTIQ